MTSAKRAHRTGKALNLMRCCLLNVKTHAHSQNAYGRALLFTDCPRRISGHHALSGLERKRQFAPKLCRVFLRWYHPMLLKQMTARACTFLRYLWRPLDAFPAIA